MKEKIYEMIDNLDKALEGYSELIGLLEKDEQFRAAGEASTKIVEAKK